MAQVRIAIAALVSALAPAAVLGPRVEGPVSSRASKIQSLEAKARFTAIGMWIR